MGAAGEAQRRGVKAASVVSSSLREVRGSARTTWGPRFFGICVCSRYLYVAQHTHLTRTHTRGERVGWEGRVWHEATRAGCERVGR